MKRRLVYALLASGTVSAGCWAAAAAAQGSGVETVMPVSTVDKLAQNGPWGLVCALLVAWCARLYLDNRADRTEFQKQLAAKDEKIFALAVETTKSQVESAHVLDRALHAI